MVINPSIFKDYDIRAVIPDQLDEEGMYQLGLAMNEFAHPRVVAIGRDMRLSSDTFFSQLAKAFTDSGVDVVDLGMITTDMSYFASATHPYDLTLMITASHNPSEYNGIKLTRQGAIAISGDSGIYNIRDIAVKGGLTANASVKGSITKLEIMEDWVKHALTFVDVGKIKPFKVIADAGNGMAGVVLKALEPYLPFKITPMYFEPDGRFPNHIANPLLPEAREEISKRIKDEHYDFGIATDGDGDRVYLIDDQGQFVFGTEMTAMLAEALLTKYGKDKIIYNAVIGRSVPEVISSLGGTPIRWRVGHALLKEKMRAEDALFAGEHSGHYFFRNNFYADAGIIALLVALEVLSTSGKPLSEYLKQYRKYPASGEINFKVEDKDGVMKAVESKYQPTAQSIDWLDGITVWFEDWWFNLRPSNTQPLLRLNVEVNKPELTLSEKVTEVRGLIESMGGVFVQE